MNEALLIFGMALVTVAIRYPALALLGRIALPEVVLRALRYVPVAVLTAITVPLVLMPDGELFIAPSNAFLVAGIAAGVIVLRTKNLLLTIGLGMLIFLLWRALISG